MTIDGTSAYDISHTARTPHPHLHSIYKARITLKAIYNVPKCQNFAEDIIRKISAA